MKSKIITVLFVCALSYSTSYSQIASNQLLATKTNEISVDASIRYYYYPNLQAYYDSQSNLFLFRLNKQWVTAESFPENYGGYSLYNKQRVKITDYDGEDITDFLPVHKVMFPYNAKGRMKNEDI